MLCALCRLLLSSLWRNPSESFLVWECSEQREAIMDELGALRLYVTPPWLNFTGLSGTKELTHPSLLSVSSAWLHRDSYYFIGIKLLWLVQHWGSIFSNGLVFRQHCVMLIWCWRTTNLLPQPESQRVMSILMCKTRQSYPFLTFLTSGERNCYIQSEDMFFQSMSEVKT